MVPIADLSVDFTEVGTVFDDTLGDRQDDRCAEAFLNVCMTGAP
jgi:hypothetical protein